MGCNSSNPASNDLILVEVDTANPPARPVEPAENPEPATSLEDISSANESHKWTAAAWLAGNDEVNNFIARALLAGDNNEADELAAVRALGSRTGLEVELRKRLTAGIDTLVGLLAPKLRELAMERQAKGSELQDKFSQGTKGMMAYGSLNTFFGGLEGLIGSPSPKVQEAMSKEHREHPDSDCNFTPSNYELTSTSRIEHDFVVAPDCPPEGGFPVEQKILRMKNAEGPKRPSLATLEASGVQPRLPVSLDELMAKLVEPNAKLLELREPEVTLVEAQGARLYTGPVALTPPTLGLSASILNGLCIPNAPFSPSSQMFVKYNSVLRGVDGKVPFLVKGMVRLCCAAEVGEQFEAGDLTFEQVLPHLNTYTSSQHVINSAIVKLSKLTYAGKVYRGVSGMALPPEFWEPNQYGVMGGIDGAFMSTTSHREVAMSYAASGGKGIVFEIQQGMCDRGADISFLSQYPHERETLFGPLTGIEVRGTRVEGAVLVIKVGLSVNLASLTIDQVLSKRRKVVVDMCDQLALKVRLQAQSEGWTMLRSGAADEHAASGPVPAVVKHFLKERLMAVAVREPDHYNENAPFGEAIGEAVALADIVGGWAEGVQALAELARVGGGSVTAAELVRSEGELKLVLQLEKGVQVRAEVLRGLCALMQARPKKAPLHVDLSQRLVGADGLAMLARAMSPTLASLDLANSNCANSGGNLAGLQLLQSRFADGQAAGLTSLDLSGNSLASEAGEGITKCLEASPVLARLSVASNPNLSGDAALQLATAALASKSLEVLSGVSIKDLRADQLTELDVGHTGLGSTEGFLLAELIKRSTALTECNLLRNALDVQTACVLAGIGTDKRVMISGIKYSQETAQLEQSNLQDEDGILVASDLMVSGAITDLYLNSNRIGDAGASAIGEALRINSVLKGLYLQNNRISDAGASAIGEALRVNSALTKLVLNTNQIGDAGASTIGETLHINSTLTMLNLYNNSIGLEGGVAIAKALEDNSALQNLYLNGNRMGDEGVTAISKALEINDALTDLDLRRNGNVDDSTKEKLKAQATKRKTLAVKV